MKQRHLILLFCITALLINLTRADEEDHEEDHGAAPETWQKWFYPILATVIISVLSLIGILVLLVRESWIKAIQEYMLMFATGTLLGASFFILIPETAETIGLDVGTSAIILGGIVFSILVEIAIHGLQEKYHVFKSKKLAENSDPKDQAPSAAEVNETDANANKLEMAPRPSAALEEGKQHAVEVVPEKSDENSSSGNSLGSSPVKSWSVIVVNVIGDGIHNLIDGILIGATFSTSVSSGWTTTAAVILHEVPQEIGDFMILRAAGLSVKKALLFNFLSAVTAILGAFIGAGVGEASEDVANYFLPISAGIFIALALSQLLPEITKTSRPFRQQLIACALGALGIGLMLVAALAIEHGHGEEDHGH